MMIVGNAIWGLLRQADAVSMILLFILFFMSVVCWTLFICLTIVMRLKRKSLMQAQERIKELSSSQDIVVFTTQFSGTIPGYFLAEILTFLKQFLQSRKEAVTRDYRLDAEQIQRTIDQTVDSIMFHQENYLPILSTSAGVATLLGLFGTVWGLIHSFINISEKQVADITVVAPGIAEALLTTLAGLLVAIPALVMYNYLLVQTRKIEHELIQFADKVNLILQNIIA